MKNNLMSFFVIFQFIKSRSLTFKRLKQLLNKRENRRVTRNHTDDRKSDRENSTICLQEFVVNLKRMQQTSKDACFANINSHTS